MNVCRKECHVSSATARPLVLVIGGALVLLAAGCASAEQPQVERVATVFEDPSADASARCDLLLPTAREQLEQDEQSSCVDAINSLPLDGGEVTGVEVWGGDAQVRLGRDTVFLSKTSSGWRVAAAACTPRHERPYDCQVEAS
jgi:hypothetical protein